MPSLRIETFPATALTQPGLRHGDQPGHGITIASRDPRVMYDVLRPGVNLVILHRALPKSVRGARMRPLLEAAPFCAVVQGPPEEVADRMESCLPARIPFDFLQDMSDLAQSFALVDSHSRRKRSGHVRMRLEGLTHDGCKKWHADFVGLRLLCTYSGPGTEWLPLPGGAATARGLGRQPPSASAMRMPTAAVAILKGEAYPDNANNGCIHRSPPAGPGKRARLLLCIDQAERNLDT